MESRTAVIEALERAPSLVLPLVREVPAIVLKHVVMLPGALGWLERRRFAVWPRGFFRRYKRTA